MWAIIQQLDTHQNPGEKKAPTGAVLREHMHSGNTDA